MRFFYAHSYSISTDLGELCQQTKSEQPELIGCLFTFFLFSSLFFR